MLGTIRVQDLQILCIVGVYPEERIQPQPLHVNIEIDLDISPVLNSEDLEETIDYAEISTMLAAWIQEKKFLLIENVAAQGCALIFATYSQVVRCKLEIKKPNAIPNAGYVSVTVENVRNQE